MIIQHPSTKTTEEKSSSSMIDPILLKEWIDSLPSIDLDLVEGEDCGNVEHEEGDLLITFSWNVWFAPGIDRKEVQILTIWVGPDSDPEEITDLVSVQEKEIESAILARLF